MQFCQVENQNFYEEAGVRDLLNVLTFKDGCLTKRGAYFETRRYPFDSEIEKCDMVSIAMFTSFVSNSQTGWHCSQI